MIVGFYGNVPDLWVMIYSQWLIKVIIALCDTPFFYYFTNRRGNIKKINNLRVEKSNLFILFPSEFFYKSR